MRRRQTIRDRMRHPRRFKCRALTISLRERRRKICDVLVDHIE